MGKMLLWSIVFIKLDCSGPSGDPGSENAVGCSSYFNIARGYTYSGTTNNTISEIGRLWM